MGQREDQNGWLRECTCIWSQTSTGGSVYIVSDSCPAAPHPRSWVLHQSA